MKFVNPQMDSPKGSLLGGFLLGAFFSPILSVLSWIALDAFLPDVPSFDEWTLRLTVVFMTPTVALGIAVLIAFRAGRTRSSAGLLTGSLAALMTMAGLIWYVLSNMRFGF